MQSEDLTGRRFGKLVALERRGVPALWMCRCDCGAAKLVAGRRLRSGRVKSCGCLARKHGHAMSDGRPPSRAYRIWSGTIARCTNPNGPAWANYGGRGITVCDRWRSFENFLADMGDPPDGLSLDRIDNNKGYEPGNCRWATRKQQQNNTRANRLVAANGITATVSEWAERTGINRQTIFARLAGGWDPAAAVTTPTMKQFSRTRRSA